MDDVRAVMDAAGSERAVLFGESEGGPMSLMFAATYPNRIQALVLFGAIVRWVDETFEGAFRPRDYEVMIDDLAEHRGDGQFIGLVAPSLREFPELLREVGGRFERMAFSPGSFRQLMMLHADLDARPIAANINVSTLVLHRSGDQVVDVRQGRWLAQHIPGARYLELEGDDHLMSAGDAESVLVAIEEFLTGAPRGALSDRVLATVLFTDIVDSTAQAAAMGDTRWRRVLDRHESLVRQLLTRYRGTEVKTTGDGFLATFDGPGRAIHCTQELISQLGGAGIDIRAGLHTGEIERRGNDIGGIAVHVAARVSALAGRGQALVSRTVKDLVAGSGITFTPFGTHELKGVPDSWELFSVAGG